ncbi:Pyrophosphate-energized vacuolar membrane proton pump [Hordeum vulgare]|nr:Pyrophosphate-energized vacuolar membrane proton pump [Hordeum vulgare]
MTCSRSDSDQSESVDCGVIPRGLEVAMVVHIALRCSREDNARSTTGSVWRDSITGLALGSFRAGSSQDRWHSDLSFPDSGLAEFESHLDRCPSWKERISAAEARLVADMAATEAADAAVRAAAKEEAIHVRIVKKRHQGNMHVLAREQDQAVREMAGLPPKEDIDGKDSSNDEQIRLDLYCVFD